MTPVAGGHVEDLAFGKTMKLLDEKRCRWPICAEDLLREPCTLNGDSHRAGHVGERRMQLPQPQLDVTDREFIEQGCQESFRQRFQQLRLLTGSDVDDALSNFRVVDRATNIVG